MGCPISQSISPVEARPPLRPDFQRWTPMLGCFGDLLSSRALVRVFVFFSRYSPRALKVAWTYRAQGRVCLLGLMVGRLRSAVAQNGHVGPTRR